MNCDQFTTKLDAMPPGGWPDEVILALRQHARVCGNCAPAWSAARSVHQGLQAMRVPEPAADFEARVLRAATSSDRPGGERRWLRPGWGAAIAAALVLGMFIGGQLFAPGTPDTPLATTASPPTNEFSGVQEQSQTVRLAFNSQQAVDNVTLTLELPPNMELAPFPGRQRISWKVSLKPGDNLLALPLKVLFPGAGTLVAHLDDGTNRKTFRADIGKDTEPPS
ncbi:hypothetical protein [Marinobacter sp. X15-166B]|uniref:hypothetical protein n=1 Tax=Marinobacter sp. X15-166B TaxID=1897620 RepID=UPI00085CBB4B|nr:hypothetical protein [Marinobacter sp. X15-166B]OEY66374.1 hypothetical protein BG841_07815 [Marinobacter sp. X15-166B]